jgi:hypothetical protein
MRMHAKTAKFLFMGDASFCGEPPRLRGSHLFMISREKGKVQASEAVIVGKLHDGDRTTS